VTGVILTGWLWFLGRCRPGGQTFPRWRGWRRTVSAAPPHAYQRSEGCARRPVGWAPWSRSPARGRPVLWGGSRAIIRIDDTRFTLAATAGLDAFSHLEIVFRFHLTDPTDLNLGARRPRDNPDWPEVGIFGHRNMRRINWLGVSRCRLLKVDGLDLHVEDLDAVDGTPVLDIKPWFTEMGPCGEVRQYQRTDHRQAQGRRARIGQIHTCRHTIIG
jgi:tRNA (Thr-GGU) A37 N-methylase